MSSSFVENEELEEAVENPNEKGTQTEAPQQK